MDQPTQTNARIDSVPAMHPRVRIGPRVSPNHQRESTIRLNKNGTAIESIHITCACGEEIVVNCVYTDKV